MVRSYLSTRDLEILLVIVLLLPIVMSFTLVAAMFDSVSAADTGPNLRPEIVEPLPNITVAVGRDATLPCMVRNLQDYKVAFVHIDRQMILTIHTYVITRIDRFSITHDKHLTWTLQISRVTAEDKGYYMCQVNTEPMLSTVGYLDVVVPPNVIDMDSSPSTVTVRENHNASLVCKAEGTPLPTITWRREDNTKILLKQKKSVQGDVLDLVRISRTEMGAYLCIAQNGVPPSVSKRIILNVEFSPMIWIPNQLVGAPLGTDVMLECHTESSPKAIAYWIFKNNMVLNTARHFTEERAHSTYKLDSRLHVKNLRPEDYGSYKCVSKNSLGETEGAIMLYELETVTEHFNRYSTAIGDYDISFDTDSDRPKTGIGGDHVKNTGSGPSLYIGNSYELFNSTEPGRTRSDKGHLNGRSESSNTKRQRVEGRKKSESNKAFWNRDSTSAAYSPLDVFCIWRGEPLLQLVLNSILQWWLTRATQEFT